MSDDSTIITECPYCNTAMDITAVAPFTRVACPSCHREMRVKVRFGTYQLESRLAIGGMSVVFIARDTLLDREVAVKILNEDYSADERRISAFEEEARITASLSHPNIVRVLTTGRAFERFFIAMELVPGGHFEHHIREAGKVPEKQMLKLAIQIANGLKAAHAAKLIHRDIKPGNILLDANGNAKIVDFGLALVTHGGTARAREFWATPYYVPPETVDGAPEDFRSDIYAFGATIYHALAGKPPCNEDSMATDVLRAAKKAVVPLHEVEPGLSQAVCRIVDKAMAYHPAERHSSYEELIRELEAAAKNANLGIATESAGDAASRCARHHRKQRIVRASALLGAGLAVISGLAWLVNQKDDAPPETANQTESADDEDRPPTGETTGLGQLHEDARNAIASRSFGAAVDRFTRLFENPAVQEPTRTWAGVQAVVAAMLDEDDVRARQLSGSVRRHAATADAGNPAIATILLPLLEQKENNNAIAFTRDEPGTSGAASQIAWLIAALHHWHENSPAAAVPFLKAATRVELDAASRWAVIYQDIARDHLADLALLDEPVYRNDPQDLETAGQAVEAIESLRTRVRSRGPIHELLRQRLVEIIGIRNRLRRQAELEAQPPDDTLNPPGDDTTAPAPPPDPDPESPPVATRADIAQVRELLANYEFRIARRLMRELDETEIERRERTVMTTLLRTAEPFIPSLEEDLRESTATIPQTKLKSGQVLVGARVGPDGGLTTADDRAVSWSDVHADTFIEWHRSRANRIEDEFERKRLHETAIAFDLLVGERERAITAIERLGEDDPNFERYWSFILANLPQ